MEVGVSYAVELDGEPLEVELNRGGGGVLATVGGERVPVRLERHPGSDLYTLAVGERRVLLWLVRGKRGVQVHWRGRSYQARVERARVRALSRFLKSRAAGRTDEEAIVATIPGLVVEVEVAEGQEVREGEGLLVIDAMKMENEIRAPCDGVVARVVVEAGREVDRGELLCVIKTNAGALQEVSAHGERS